jgi:hypothetical protein
VIAFGHVTSAGNNKHRGCTWPDEACLPPAGRSPPLPAEPYLAYCPQLLNKLTHEVLKCFDDLTRALAPATPLRSSCTSGAAPTPLYSCQDLLINYVSTSQNMFFILMQARPSSCYAADAANCQGATNTSAAHAYCCESVSSSILCQPYWRACTSFCWGLDGAISSGSSKWRSKGGTRH